MTESVFQPLFELEFFHNFYLSKAGELTREGADLKVEPTAACLETLSNYGLLFRETPRGMVIMYRGLREGEAVAPHIPIDTSLSLSFTLRPLNPHWLYYSELPLDKSAGGVYYLNNLQVNQQSSGPGGSQENLLTRDVGAPYLSELDYRNARPTAFTYLYEGPESKASLTIKDVHGNAVLTREAFLLDGKLQFFAELGSLPAGAYSLEINGSPVEDFYWGPADNPPLAVVSFFTGPEVPEDYRFVDNAGEVSFKRYTVRLDNRKTIWKYNVGLKYRKDVDPEDLEVVSSDFPASFVRRGNATLADDTVVVPFDSDSALLPLRQDPVTGIELQRKTTGLGGGGKETTALPNPKITNLTRADGKLYSEVFIYV